MSEGRPTGWEGADRWFSTEAGGTGGGGAAEPPPVVPPCEVCGGELEADQTYCLECGSPTPLAPRLHRGAGRTVAILAGAAVILGLGAGALAFAVVRDDGGDGTTPGSPTGAPLVPTGPQVTVPLPPETAPTTGALPPDTSFTTPTTPVVTAPDTSGFDTVTAIGSVPTTAPATEPDTTGQAPPTTQSAGGASDWPAGRTAWTAILASTRSQTDARAAKTRVAGAGDPAGVLFSTDFTGLRPGYWVVFSGTYASRNTAIAQAVKLRPDFPSAYARRIEG